MRQSIIISLSLFLLGACANRPKESVESTEELSAYWHTEISELYDAYTDGDGIGISMELGIPSSIHYQETTEKFPWVNAQDPNLPNAAELEEWSNNVILNVSHGMLMLKGAYSTLGEKKIEKGLDALDFTYVSEYEGPIISAPIDQLGGLRVQVTSHLTDGEDSPIPLEAGTLPLDVYMEGNEGDKKSVNFNLGLKVNDGKIPGNCEGYIEVEFFRPDTTFLLFPIDPKHIGQEYEMMGVHFKLNSSQPGDIVIEYTAENAISWNIVPVMKGKTMGDDQESRRSFGGLKHDVLYRYNHPGFSFAEYLVQIKCLDLKKMDATPDMIRRAAKGIHNNTPDEIRAFHETAGAWLAYFSVKDAQEKFNYEEYKDLFVRIYDMMEKKEGDRNKVYTFFVEDGCKHPDSYENIVRNGMGLSEFYRQTKLKPNWDIIDSSAKKFLDRWATTTEHQEQIDEYWVQHSEKLLHFIQVNTPLPLTDEDIEYLCTHKAPVEEHSENDYYKRAIWFKTNMDAEAVYIYPSLFDYDIDEKLSLFRTEIQVEH